MQIPLDLRNHCIETELRKRYNQAISLYFKKKTPDKDLEQQIENLETALKTLDFGYLRKEFPALAGHHDDDVIILFDKEKEPIIMINGIQIAHQHRSGNHRSDWFCSRWCCSWSGSVSWCSQITQKR